MTDELTLTLYYYDDGLTATERHEVEVALGDDPVLATRFAKMRKQLDQMSEPEEQPAPPHLVQRWHDSIDDAARSKTTASATASHPVHFWSFFWGAAVTGALALGIGIGAYFSGTESLVSTPDTTIAGDVPVSTAVVPASFTRGLEVHLQQSQWDISRLSVNNGSDRSALFQQIIEQNRMFEVTADQNGAPNLARVLRAFEPILLRLAADDIAPEDAEALRAQLSFELNAMLTKLASDTSKETHST